jgi:hypothetical protein
MLVNVTKATTLSKAMERPIMAIAVVELKKPRLVMPSTPKPTTINRPTRRAIPIP